MKKQINYCPFIPRIFSFALDLSLVTIPAYFITNFISFWLSILFFKVNNVELAKKLITNPDFFTHISLTKLLLYNILMYLLFMVIYGIYFISFWFYLGATPGKMIMHMKIVDAITFKKPTKGQLVKRYCGYLLALFGIWFMLFSKQRQALHDKIAGTVVIKS